MYMCVRVCIYIYTCMYIHIYIRLYSTSYRYWDKFSKLMASGKTKLSLIQFSVQKLSKCSINSSKYFQRCLLAQGHEKLVTLKSFWIMIDPSYWNQRGSISSCSENGSPATVTSCATWLNTTLVIMRLILIMRHTWGGRGVHIFASCSKGHLRQAIGEGRGSFVTEAWTQDIQAQASWKALAPSHKTRPGHPVAPSCHKTSGYHKPKGSLFSEVVLKQFDAAAFIKSSFRTGHYFLDGNHFTQKITVMISDYQQIIWK